LASAVSIALSSTDAAFGFGHVLALLNAMTLDEKDWRQLCARAAVESDPNRLLEIIDQLIVALDERRDKMRQQGQHYEVDPASGISGK
jgi:hypothetical protein